MASPKSVDIGTVSGPDLRREIQEALSREKARALSAFGPPPTLIGSLFAEQRSFASDPARHKTAVCSRRAGKTVACATSLLDSVLRREGAVGLYLTLSRINAKRILWRTMLDMNREFHLGGVASESELCMRFGNGSVVYLSGLSDRQEVDKYRGLPLANVIVDEAQAVPPFLEELVDAVLTPSLMDFDGSLALVGTPGPVPNSYFHNCSKTWSNHAWNVFQNPHIERKSRKAPRQHLNAELKRRGVSEHDPLIQREWFGRWVSDPNSLVFRYDARKNDFSELPEFPKPWEFVICVDLGFHDSDAIGVIAWNTESPNLYLVDEAIIAKQTVTELGEILRPMYERYRPVAIVMDTGGLGKKIAEELTKRLDVPIEAADKARKLEHIELLNDALRSGRLFAKSASRFAHDCALVEWDKKDPQKPKISDRFHSDICDAVLYGFRKCLAWLHQPPNTAYAPVGSKAWYTAQIDEMQGMEEERLKRFQDEFSPKQGFEEW